MRQATQSAGFAGRVRQATFHIAALDEPIYQDMRICWHQLRDVQRYINIFLPRIEEDDRETAYENIGHRLGAVTQLVTKITVENKHTKDPMLKALIETQLIAFYVKFNLVKLNFGVVSFLTNLVRHHIPAFNKGVKKYGGKAFKGVKTVGGKTVEGAAFVGKKAITGGVIVHGHVARVGKSVYDKIAEWSAAVKKYGFGVLEKWSGLDEDDVEEFTYEAEANYEDIQRNGLVFEQEGQRLDSQHQ